jgi:putative pyruvate formate lyase activating enzyme
MDTMLSLLEQCKICPRQCRVNRLNGKRGYCGIGKDLIIAHYDAHFGEEPPITGTGGSGNIFFCSCNLRCVYCQNYQISRTTKGKRISIDELIDIFFHLQQQGVHNINLVSPTPYAPLIGIAIRRAKEKGITIPFVYNTNAYENKETIHMLDGLIDIYLPDFKYWNILIAKRLSDAPDYRYHAQASILEMKHQVGNLSMENGIATKGILVRHLVLPGNLSGTKKVLLWIKEYLGKDTFISLLSQYYPAHRAQQYPLLKRRITEQEYHLLLNFLVEHSFKNVFTQELESALLFVPDFNKAKPFDD